jgi:hypothetical protein
MHTKASPFPFLLLHFLSHGQSLHAPKTDGNVRNKHEYFDSDDTFVPSDAAQHVLTPAKRMESQLILRNLKSTFSTASAFHVRFDIVTAVTLHGM